VTVEKMISLVKRSFKTFAEFAAQRKTTRQKSARSAPPAADCKQSAGPPSDFGFYFCAISGFA
jgi:hypothetical protein